MRDNEKRQSDVRVQARTREVDSGGALDKELAVLRQNQVKVERLDGAGPASYRRGMHVSEQVQGGKAHVPQSALKAPPPTVAARSRLLRHHIG